MPLGMQVAKKSIGSVRGMSALKLHLYPNNASAQYPDQSLHVLAWQGRYATLSLVRTAEDWTKIGIFVGVVGGLLGANWLVKQVSCAQQCSEPCGTAAQRCCSPLCAVRRTLL